jgi:outer membrane lipoprotein LolB
MKMAIEARRRWCQRAFAVLFFALLVSGCAAPRAPAIMGESSWNGRLALSVQSDPPQSYSAGFDLRGSPTAGELLLATPLGTTLATVTWAPGRAEMVQGDRKTQKSSLDELAADLGGASIPVTAMFAWLQGRPAEVDGWQADLSRHADGRVTARRSQPPPTAELRLIFEP